MSRGTRTCALLLALTFLMATALGNLPTTGAGHCQKCRPGCPMHATGGTSGHHGSQMGCHHGREPGLRCNCGNHSDSSTSPVPAGRAILTPSPEGTLAAVHSRPTHAVRFLTTQFVLEPPTDPPRASVV